MDKKDKRANVKCPKCETGAMVNVSSKMAIALGMIHTECDRCHYRQAIRIKN